MSERHSLSSTKKSQECENMAFKHISKFQKSDFNCNTEEKNGEHIW